MLNYLWLQCMVRATSLLWSRWVMYDFCGPTLERFSPYKELNMSLLQGEETNSRLHIALSPESKSAMQKERQLHPEFQNSANSVNFIDSSFPRMELNLHSLPTTLALQFFRPEGKQLGLVKRTDSGTRLLDFNYSFTVHYLWSSLAMSQFLQL